MIRIFGVFYCTVKFLKHTQLNSHRVLDAQSSSRSTPNCTVKFQRAPNCTVKF